MKDCLFCKIAYNEIPSYKIYEDDLCYAFLDISGDFEGHTLLIPKKHSENILDCNKMLLGQLFKVAQEIGNHYVKNCDFDGVNIFTNAGESADQSIMHFHIHILPRKKTDKTQLFVCGNAKGKDLDLEKICNKLKIN